MKKTFKTMLALMAGAMTFTGCTSDILENTPEQIPSALKPMTFTATQESDATRAAIVGTAINWTTGDKISIFDGATENNGNQEFTLTGEAGKPSGTFDGEAATASTYYALYPYAASSSESRVPTQAEAVAAAGSGADQLDFWKERLASGDTRYIDQTIFQMGNEYGISSENQAIIIAYSTGGNFPFKSGPQLNAGKIEGVAFPAAQTATVGTADPKAMLMIGTSDDTKNIQFKNVCAYLKVTPTFACSSIVLKSNGTESLAGTVTVDYNSGEPTTTVTNGTSTVTLSGTIAANSTYYIAVLPATLASGFTVEFKDASDKVIGSKSTTKENVTFARNKVINLGSFDALPTPPEGSVGTAKRTGEIDVNWVQLWENGPKFAEYNVGAANNKAEDYGGYYCWGKSVDKDPTGTCNTDSDPLTGADDTATNLWGSEWRMPTKAELEALLNSDNCTCTWDGTNKGFLCTGKGDYATNSIFLPAAGSCSHGTVIMNGEEGYYWSSTPYDEYQAKWLFFDPYNSYVANNSHSCGFSVRAVLDETPATTGTAKATIGGSEVDVNWVQLWADGPKFAENNVAGQMSFEDATETGADYVWGANWCTPSKDEMDELVKAASSTGSEKVTCVYGKVSGVCGFTFTGKGEGYTSNSVFFPATSGYESFGTADYWSGTEYAESSDKGYAMTLLYDEGSYNGRCSDQSKDGSYLVRPVLAK